jgi:gliding motility-associated-like protein
MNRSLNPTFLNITFNVFVSILLVLGSFSTIQAQGIVSAKRLGSTGTDEVFKLLSDRNGFIYAMGYYSGTLNIDSAGSIKTYAGYGGRDIFIGKFTCDFNPVWVNRIGSNQNEGGDFLFGSLDLDSLGNIYVAGSIGNNATFTSTVGTSLLVSTAGDLDGFLAKYDNNGIRQWVVRQGGAQKDETHSVKLDSDGYLYVVGGFRGTATYHTTSGSTASRASNGNIDGFIAKYNTDGVLDVSGVRSYGSNIDDLIQTVESDMNGHLYYVGGTCCSNSGFNIGSTTINNIGSWGSFFFKTNRNLDVIWVNQMGNAQSENLSTIKYADSNYFYLYGHFDGTVTLPSQTPGLPQNLTSAGSFDMLLAKYDSAGVLISGKRYGSTGLDYSSSGLVINNKNEPLITGLFSNTVSFDGNSVTSFGSNSAFVVKLNNTLTATNAWRMGGTGNDYGKGLALGNAGEVYASGTHTTPGTFGTINIGSYGGNDGYIAQFSKLNPPQIVVNSGSTCAGFNLILKNTLVGASYQWLKDNTPITGATDSFYYATIPGLYRAIIVSDCISDTSDSFNVEINLLQGKNIDTNVCNGSLLSLNGIDTGVTSFSWSPTAGLSNTNTLTPTLNVLNDVTYILTKVYSNGCAIQDTFKIKSKNCCFTCSSLPTSLGSGLIACYEFSNNANDGSIEQNNGIINGASLTQDRFSTNSNAYQFNGQDNYISVPTSPSLNNIDSAITITFWANFQGWSTSFGNSFASVVSKTTTSSALHFRVSVSPNGYSASNNGKTWTQTSLTDSNLLNSWEFYAVSMSGNELKFYKNGILIDNIQNPTASYTLNTNNLLRIGRGDSITGDFLHGKLDDIRIYNRPLTSSEVSEIYTFGSTNTPPFVNAGTDIIICNAADSILLDATANIGKYKWSPSGNLSDSTILKPILSNPTNSSLIISNTVGSCVVSDTLNIEVINVTINAGTDTLVCKGDSIQLSATSNIAFKWKGEGYISDSLVLNPYVKPDTTTTYIILADITGCTISDTVVVSVPYLIANAGSDKSICLGDSIAMNATAVGSFRWNTSFGLSDSLILNPFAKPDSSFTYVIISSEGNCLLSDSVQIQVLKPFANAGMDVVMCKFDSIQLNGTGSGVIAWQTANGLTDTSSAKPFVSPIQTQLFILTSNIGNCIAYDTVSVSVKQIEANAGADILVCSGDTVQLQGQAQGSFYWKSSEFLSDTSILNPFVRVISTNSYVLIVNDSGCFHTDTVTIAVNGNIFLNAGLDTTICKGDTIQLSATNGINYNWAPSYNISDTSAANPIIWPFVTTDYIVKSTQGSCINYDTISITVRDLPIVNAGMDTLICLGDEIQLNPTTSATIIGWTPSIWLNDSNELNPIAKPLGAITYNIIVSDGKCFNLDSLNIDIINPPSIDAGSDLTICEGESIQLRVIGASKVIWSPGIYLDDSLITEPIASPSESIIYTVSTNEFGCISSDSVTVIVNPLPIIDAGMDTIVCLNSSFNFISTASGADVYEWTPNSDLSNPTALNPSAIISKPVLYKLSAKNSITGCLALDSISIIPEMVNAKFQPSVTEGAIPLNVQFINTSSGASFFDWDFGDGQTSNQTSPRHLYTQAGEFEVTLTATSNRGCIDTTRFVKIITIDNVIINIPNAFTPNGDGINDDFRVFVSNAALVKHIKGNIWDRWGGKVIDFNMPGGAWWNGTANGTVYPESVYVYTIEVEDIYGKVYKFNGTVTLLR